MFCLPRNITIACLWIFLRHALFVHTMGMTGKPSENKPLRALFPLALLAAPAAAAFLAFPFIMKAMQPSPAPQAFSHATHTGKAAMPCQSCHAFAEKGMQAGMPPASSCLDCHRHILADDPRLLPMHAAANPDSPLYTGEPLHWVRRAPLPAYAHFNHAPHLAKGYSCQRCHPNPDAPVPDDMSSCLNCHREQSLPTDCTQCHY